MSMDVLVIFLMAVGLVIFVGEPFVRRGSVPLLSGEDEVEMERLLLQKQTLYTAIQDLDFDFQTSKVDAKDYDELRGSLENEALQLLRQIDDVDPLAVLDNELERQILALRQQPAPDTHLPSQEVCFGCGAALQGGESFCPSCGQPLIPS